VVEGHRLDLDVNVNFYSSRGRAERAPAEFEKTF
jgi:hypothetical protein